MALVADCCAPADGTKRPELNAPARIAVKKPYLIIFEVIVSPL